ncbi:MAG: TetR/AcrR family transcriptional regulator [Myxococcota bacterium]|nr:TetR/AcrR family transcriptional regulator [Myxococcota bacterium]
MEPVRPIEQRRSRQRAEARRAILDATAALLLEGGAESLSMRRVAERSGYTPPTIYHYFGDKNGLLDALLEERFGELVSHLRRVPRTGDAEQDLRAMARAFVRFGLENPTHYRLLMTPRDDDSDPPRSAEDARAMLEAPLRELEVAKRFVDPDFETTAQALWAALHGVISLRTSRPEYEWTANMTEHTVDSMIRGLLEPSGSCSARAPRRSR